MNFDFSEEQKQFRTQLRKLLESVSPLSECRRALEGRLTYSEVAWQQLAKLGFQATTIPEALGGIGLGYLELCVAAEEIGRSLSPVPTLSSTYICAEAIRLYGSEDQKKEWLPGFASGLTTGTWAVAEHPGEIDSNRLATEFAAGRLSGTKMPVLDGMSADVCVVLARDSGNNPLLVIADLRATEVQRTPVGSVDPSRPLAKITFAAAPADLLGAVTDVRSAYNDILDRAAVLLAFEQVGGADRALLMARDYALDRHAFGRPIGANQAIKHKLANVYIKNEVARAHAYYGAWTLSSGPVELPLAAAGARVAATDAFVFAAQENIQTHGGIGFTWESDCQLFYRRARFSATALGSSTLWKERIVHALEDQ